MKLTTEELDGHLLDYAVLLASGGAPEGYVIRAVDGYWVLAPTAPRRPTLLVCNDRDFAKFALMGNQNRRFQPSADWAATGQILERAGISLSPSFDEVGNVLSWSASRSGVEPRGFSARSPLVAVLRCFVHLKLGEEFEA